MTNSGDDFVFSFKPTTDYDSPLLVVKAATVEELNAKFDDIAQHGMWARVADIDTEMKAAWTLAKTFNQGPDVPPAGNGNAGYNQQSNQYQGNSNQNQQNNGYAQQNQGQGQNQNQGQNQRPAGRQPTPPGMVAPNCPHGTKTYVEGQYGPFWGCPGRQNDPSRCKPEKIR